MLHPAAARGSLLSYITHPVACAAGNSALGEWCGGRVGRQKGAATAAAAPARQHCCHRSRPRSTVLPLLQGYPKHGHSSADPCLAAGAAPRPSGGAAAKAGSQPQLHGGAQVGHSMVGTVNTFQVGNMHQQPASAAAPLRHQPAPLMLDGGTGVDSGSSCPTLTDARLLRPHAWRAAAEGCSTHPAWVPASA